MRRREERSRNGRDRSRRYLKQRSALASAVSRRRAQTLGVASQATMSATESREGTQRSNETFNRVPIALRMVDSLKNRASEGVRERIVMIPAEGLVGRRKGIPRGRRWRPCARRRRNNAGSIQRNDILEGVGKLVGVWRGTKRDVTEPFLQKNLDARVS